MVQLTALRQLWPAFTASVRRGLLVAEGWVTPASLARPYRVELRYNLSDSPKVWVREPRIVALRAPNDPVPHVYDRATDPRPCLYYPAGHEWSRDKFLATTVMPWLLMWLTFYEIWLATGTWLGDGIEHGTNKREHA